MREGEQKMRYTRCREAVFLARPNRFIARVILDGTEISVHVKNTGRCRELLLPGAKVILSQGNNPARKTKYDLVAVWKGELLVNLDAQAPNVLAAEYLPRSGLFAPHAHIRPEYTHGDSRFDFYIEEDERKHLMEAKGVTLEERGHAFFPDAPTQRGVKHINGLIRALDEGFESWLFFVVQMEGMTAFSPNDRTHPAFGEALRRANEAGVHLLAMGCQVDTNGAKITYPIPILL